MVDRLGRWVRLEAVASENGDIINCVPHSPTPSTETYILVPTLYLICMSNEVRIQQLPQGQFTVTIPRALAQALGIEKGHPAKWVLRDGELVLRLK